jgi:hypothetical protein
LHFLFLALSFLFAVNAIGQNLLSTNYTTNGVSPNSWYNVAANCKLDTVAGSYSVFPGNGTAYYSAVTPKSQSFGTRTTTSIGINGDGASANSSTNNTAGRYFEFKLSPISSAFSLTATSISLSAFYANTTGTVYGALLYSTDGTTWISVDGRSITATPPTAGAGSLLAVQSSATAVTPTVFSINLVSTPISISSGQFLRIRFIPMRANSTATSSLVAISDVTIAGTVNSLGITASPTSLTGFNYNVGAGPSTSSSFSVGGNYSNLTSSIFVTAPPNYEISTTSNFASTTSPIELPQTGGNVASTIIYVRLKAGLYGGTYNENISLTSSTAAGAISQNISCSGSVTGPVINITPSTLAYFNTSPSINSANQTVTVSGSNLSQPVTIAAPAHFQISTDNITFSNSAVLFPAGATLPNTTLYIRLFSTSVGTYKENITFSSTNALTRTIRCIGFVRNTSPSINIISPVSLSITGLDYNIGFGPSSPAKNFSFTAFNLTDTSLTVKPKSTSIEFSTDSINFVNSLTFLTDTLGNVDNQIVYVRLKASLAAATYNDSAIISSAGSGPTYTKRILCQGIVFPNAFINEPTTLTRFIYYSGANEPSTLQRVPIKATTLATNNLTVSLGANSKYEFYTSSDPTYTSTSKNIVPNAGAVTDTIFIRLKSGLTAASYIDTITLSTLATGATSRKIVCSGIVVPETVYTETFFGSTLGSAGAFYYSTNFTNAVNYGEWTRSNAGSSNNSIWTPTNTSVCGKFKTAATSFIQTPKLPGVNAIYFSVAESITGITDSVTVTDGGSMNAIFKYSVSQIVPSYYSNTNTINPSVNTTDQYKFSFPSLSGVHYLDNIVFTFKKPTTQDSAITVGHSASADTIKWKRPVNSNGNKNQGCIVFVGKGTFTPPVSGVSYSANSSYGNGSALGNYYCVYNDSSNSVTVTGLIADSTYNIYVLEYNGIKGQKDENYNTTNIPSNTTRPTATISGTSQNINCGDNVSVSIAVTGTGPWSGTLSDGSTFNSTTSPININFNPASPTNYSITNLSDLNFNNVTTNLNGAVNITIASGVWRGSNSSSWDDAANWCGGSIPTGTTNIIVPSNAVNMPVISQNNSTIKDITIENGANISINDGGKLEVKGDFILNGSLANNGTISFTSSTSQSFPNGNGAVITMDSIEINKLKVSGDTMVFNKSFSIIGALVPISGNIKLNNDTITLLSSNTGTASIGNANGASFSYSPTGKFIVERYIPTIGLSNSISTHSKSWQLLAAPTFGQTIQNAWQEGAISRNQDPKPGYGTQIIGQGTGYDTTGNAPGLKTYDPENNLWSAVNRTDSLFDNGKAYMIFVRGDRSVKYYNSTSIPTTLRTTGKIFSPSNVPENVNVPAGKFQAIGNPYASAIDFVNFTNTNSTLDKYFYVWDPYFSTLGGYRLYSFANGWDDGFSTPNYTGANTLIQSGQAFFVHNAGNADVTLSFNEDHKVAGSRMTFRPANSFAGIKTFIRNSNGKIADATRLALDPTYGNAYESNDAVKLFNNGENLSIVINNKVLAIDARASINHLDTVFYQVNNLTNQQYQLKFSPENMQALTLGMKAFLIDKFTQSITEVSLFDSTVISFETTADVNSHSPSRFYLIFKTAAALPVTFIDVKAKRIDNKKVIVDWVVDNERNIHHYDVERSFDGIHFNKIATIVSIQNTGSTANYTYTDENESLSGKVFYRVKSIENNNSYQYSKVVALPSITIAGNISINPNPINDQRINLCFNNQPLDVYSITILNSAGQIMLEKDVAVTSNKELIKLDFGTKYASGNYLLKVSNKNVFVTSLKLLKP